jgi:hypothetical protein
MEDIFFKVVPKDLFFDRAHMRQLLGEGAAEALSKIGAFVMTRARTSIRSSKYSAKPGKPPRSHAGDLKNKIYFAFSGSETGQNSVVIGPLEYKKGEAPGLLEFGGDVNRERRVFRRVNGKNKIVVRNATLHYRGNPFMAPALKAEVEAGTIPPAWEGVVRAR